MAPVYTEYSPNGNIAKLLMQAEQMNDLGSIFPPDFVLTDQVARQVFELLPEAGPVMLIISKDGHFWPSDSERFAELDICQEVLSQMCSKIDDGAEPVVSQADDCSIVASQLRTEGTDCGYVVIFLPEYSPESTLINIELIEILLNQVGLITNLIEKNSRLYELQVKHFSAQTPN